MGLRFHLLLVAISVVGAHALTYFLIGVLPDAAVMSLGLESAREQVVAAFHAAHGVRSYSQVLADLARLNLGETLDGVPVSQELAQAIFASSPRVLWGLLAVIVVCLGTALYAPARGTKLDHVASFVSFLPPYIMPFLGLLCLLISESLFGSSVSDTISLGISVVAIAAVPASLIAVQTSSISRRNLQSDFARTLLAVGATALYQRTRLLHNVIAEIIPSLEKTLTGMLAALLFAEPVLGLSGFGTTAIRAIKRSDPDLLLGVTLILAVSVGLCRLIAILVRRHYGLSL